MQINVLLPTGTRTVDLDELKELARQGVVQPSTLLETGGQRGKAKNVPALKPIFDELAAAQTPTHTQTPQTSNPEPPAAPSETQDFVAVLRAVGQKNAPPQPLVDENAYSDAGTGIASVANAASCFRNDATADVANPVLRAVARKCQSRIAPT
ncbi:MAG: hypothetical protein IJO46_00665 [Thermoguttaceae bacterium]|nr:hypothetical protein [Thermoguttaceae bacterium]